MLYLVHPRSCGGVLDTTLSHNVVSSTPPHERGFELTTVVVIGTDCTGSSKSKLPYNHGHNGPRSHNGSCGSSECCLIQSEQFSSYIMGRTSYILMR